MNYSGIGQSDIAMTIRNRASRTAAALLAWLLMCLSAGIAVGHQGPHAAPPDAGPVLGSLTFPTSSGNPQAQALFVEGMLFLHLFEYQAALERFQQAQALEPGFVMAHWGEAMTHNHPIWDEQNRDLARAALDRLAPTAEARAARAGTDIERAWLDALEILYGEGPKAERDRSYLRHLANMAERWPDDHEVRLFHALALFGVHAGVRHLPDYLRATAIAQDVFSANPNHPGAAHYLIHGVDDPVHAVLGLSAARALGRMAPDAAHAQHMTAHIYLELGMWPDVVRANRAAAAVSNRHRAARGQPERHTGHSNFWLLYGLLQLGEKEQARALLEAGWADRQASDEPPPEPLELDPDTSLTGSLVQMWARHIIETRDWNGGLLKWSFEFGDSMDPPITHAYLRSLAGFLDGDTEAGMHWRGVFEGLRVRVGKMIAGQAEIPPSQPVYLQRLAVMALQLDALQTLADGDSDAALALAAQASRRESEMPLAFGPPYVDYPAAELHGDMLTAAGRDTEAIAAYRAQLARSQCKTLSVRGLAAAAERAGVREAAAEGCQTGTAPPAAD